MRVLFATAELSPVARVGGLAEASSGLVAALREQGTEVEVVLPDYGSTELGGQETVAVDTPDWAGEVRVRRGRHAEAGDLTLVHVPGMDRPHPYVDEHGEGWPDNDRRFLAFSAAIAALAERGHPDVMHLNDWHTAATVGLMTDRPPTVLTVHTLAHQGVCDRSWLDRLPVSAHRFAWYDATNPLAGAIELVDRVIAVSPTYAAEIVTPEAGMGLHERLAALGERLVGILNGIDVSIWNPADDPHIASPYSRADPSGRTACREALAAWAGWPDDGTPIVATIGRLVEQKGIDILLDTVPFLANMPARLVVLGAGARGLVTELNQAARRHPDRVRFHEGHDDSLAHRLFAGSDLFVMPSRFEPCGLAQMQSMTYGAIPVVTDVGGLHDTVVDADAAPWSGTGFVAATVDTAGLVDALHRAIRTLGDPGRARSIRERGMSADWSWSEPATRHLEIYRQVTRQGTGTASVPLASTTTPPSETV